MATKQKIIAGRKAVEACRQAHHALHLKPWHKGVPQEHTPLLNAMLKVLEKQGFNSIQQFFDANGAFVKEDLAKAYQRLGGCNQCGKCCEHCPDYQGNGVCRIPDNRPQLCRDYPTIRDLLMGVPEECSYSLNKIKEPSIDWRWV